MKIAVLMGSDSPEREISIKTGEAVKKALLKMSYDVECIEFSDDIGSTIPKLSNYELVFNALHGGIGENGTVQGLLECLKIPYTGSGVFASSVCMNKHFSKTIVSQMGYKTPDWILLKKGEQIPLIDYFPVIVKPKSQGSTVGLTLVENKVDLEKAIRHAFEYDEEVLLETFISGRELTVSIVGNEILPIVEIIPSNRLYDYECKYSQGMSHYICSPKLSENLLDEIKETGVNIYKQIGCTNYGRIDFRLNEDNIPWFLEVNTLPGMTDTSLLPMAAHEIGWSFEFLIETIVSEVMQ